MRTSIRVLLPAVVLGFVLAVFALRSPGAGARESYVDALGTGNPSRSRGFECIEVAEVTYPLQGAWLPVTMGAAPGSVSTQPAITSVASDAGNCLLFVGDTVHFTLKARWAGGMAYIDLGEVRSDIELYDDGTHGDTTAGDAIYEVDYVLTADDVGQAHTLTGRFRPAGQASQEYRLTGTAVSVADWTAGKSAAAPVWETVSEAGGTYEYAAGRAVIAFREDIAFYEVAEILLQYDLKLTSWLPEIGVYEVELPAGMTFEQLRDSILDETVVEEVSRNSTVRWLGSPIVVPDHLSVTYQANSLNAVRARQAWVLSKGSSTVDVAVIDSGALLSHPDLAGTNLELYRCTGCWRDDGNGHGTPIVGIILAEHGTTGTMGLAPNLKLHVYQTYTIGTSSINAAAELLEAANNASIDVISISSGAESDNPDLRRAVAEAIGNGKLVIAAAGNDPWEIVKEGNTGRKVFPASYANVLAVGTSTGSGYVAYDDNYGDEVIFAPRPVHSPKNDGAYESVYGTSYAAPQAAALAGLILSIDSRLEPDEVIELMTETADPLPADPAYPDNTTGLGRINFYRALYKARNGTDPGYDALPTAPDDFEAVFLESQSAPAVELSWTSGTDPEGKYAGVHIYRRDMQTDETVQLKQGNDVLLTGNTFIDTDIDYNTGYWYFIFSVDAPLQQESIHLRHASVIANQPDNRPPEVHKPQPYDRASDVNPEVVLSWTGSDPDFDALTYTVYMGTAANLVFPVAECTNISESQCRLASPLAFDQTYYWEVDARDPDGEVTTGGPWSFMTRAGNRQPYTPFDPNPYDGQDDLPLDLTLKWRGGDPEGDTVTYSVYLGDQEDLTFPVTGCQDIDFLECRLPYSLAYGSTKYWEVIAVDQYGASSTGGPWVFTTRAGNQPPRTPYDPVPGNGASNISTTTGLDWRGGDPDGDDVTYTVYMDDSPGPLYPVAGCIDVELSECLPTEALAFDKTYFWEVTAEDEFGAITTGGPWSFSTRTTNRAPNPPQALYPSPDATGVPRDVVLAWRGGDPDGDDVTYSVFKGTTRNSLFPVPGCQDIEEEECDLGQLDYSSTHYWQVDATDSHQATVQSSVWKFTVENENRPPAEATNPNPSVGATGVDTETNLTWSGGSDPDGDSVTFDVYLYRSTDAIPAGPLPQCTGLSVKVCDPGTLDSGTSYRWFVEPKDEHGAQPVITSQPWTFTTRSDNNPPYAPYDPQPSNASTNASLDPVLTWKGGDPDAGDIVTYDVYLSPDEDSLVAPLAGCANLTQKSCQPGRLESFTYYYWKVVATDKYGAMNVGGPWRFRTLNNPPGAIEPLTPADGAKDQPLNVELTWKTSTDPDGDSVKYYVYLQANDSTPEKYYPCSDLTAPRCKPSKDLEPNTKYYWFVEVQDSKGAAYRPSPAWSFTTGAGPNQPPNEPNGPSPYDGARDVKIIDSGNLLRWNGGDPDGDDVTYEVYLEVGDSTPDKLVCPTTDKLICDPGTLAYGKHYYWQVVATDEHGDSTVGEVWEFWTEDEPQPAAKIDIALIIDSSESMKWNDEDDMRKDAAKLFIGSMIDGDQVAVVAFDTSARVLWRLATLTQANRANAQAAVDQVNSDGYSTNLGAGLRAGYEQLNSSTASANPKVAVFLTDGEGDYNNEASLYIAKGWRVYTVGLGSDIDEPLLNRIALETGGQYRHLTDPNELHQVYLDIYDSATNSTTVVNKTVTVRPNQTTTVNATIAANQSSATFAIDLAGTQSTSRTIDLAQVTMELVDPSGNTIRPSSTDPAVYYDEGDTWALFRITRPQAGTWQIKLTGAALRASDIPVRVRVSQRDPEPPPPPPPPTGWQPIGSASGNGISADSSDSVRVDVAVAANGTLYAAWADEGGRIFVRKWNGSAWSDISGTGLSCGGSDARSPAIALDSGNQPIVAWSETKGNDEICIRRYSGSGTSWSSLGGGVVSNTSGDSQDAAIAVSGDGTVYVAWRDSSAGNSEIYVKRLDGSSWNEFGSSASGGGISNSANGYSGRPTIAVDGNNRPFVAYTDNYTGTRQVYVKRWTGSSWTAAGSNAAGDGGVSNNSGQSGHAVVRAAPNGTIYLTWQDTTPNQGGEIYVLRYDGSKWVSVGTNSAQGGGISNTTAATDQPALAIGPDNRPCVAWHEGPSSGPREIFARCYDGSTWAERSSSAHAGGISNNSGDSWRAKMAIDGSSNIYVLWEDNSGGGDYDIYGRRWSP